MLGHSVPRRPCEARATLVCCALVACGLAAAALPRLIAGAWYYRTSGIYEDFLANKPLPPAALDRLASQRAAMVRILPLGGWYADESRALYKLAADKGVFTPEGSALLRRSAEAGRDALAHAPIDPYTWTILAYIDFLTEGASSRTGPYLAMAYRAAPVEWGVTAPRLQLTLLLWRTLDAQTRFLATADIRLLWQRTPRTLVSVAKRSAAIDIVSAALGADGQAFACMAATRPGKSAGCGPSAAGPVGH